MKKGFYLLLSLSLAACLLCACAASTEPGKTEGTASVSNGSEPAASANESKPASSDLADGIYYAEFKTDSSMFHANEACDGKGTLTVQDGVMTIHVSLASKGIVNLFPGKAAEAQAEGAQLLQPTVDTVTYSDGMTEEVYGFDVPVPALDQDFDLALIGTKGTWYDHVVSVSNPEPAA